LPDRIVLQQGGISTEMADCSDSDVGHKRKKDDDIVQTFTHELRYPATIHVASLPKKWANAATAIT